MLFLVKSKYLFMLHIPLSPNFLIKVPKQEEENKREKDGSIYLHPNYVWMTRNTQCGFIEGISGEAAKQLPEAKEGDILLIHHFVQRSNSSEGDNDKFLVMQDEEYKYYNVTSKEVPGQNNMTYGVYRDGEIIPHPQYVFLEKEIDNKDGWYQTPDEIFEKIEHIKKGIEILSRNKQTSELLMEVKKREAEMTKLSMSLQAKEYLPYKIAFANKALGIPNGTTVFCLNIACQTLISVDVLGRKFRIIEAKYVATV